MKKCGYGGWLTVLLAMLLTVAAQAEGLFVFTDDDEAAADAWAYPVPLEAFADPMDVLRLINKENLLDKSYPNQDIAMYEMVPVTAPTTKDDMLLRPIVNDAITAMLAAADAEGIKLYVGSAYRKYRNQEVMHYNRVKRMGHDDGFVQMAGASEHQAGLAADVVSWAYRNDFKTEFGETKEGIWLAENCAAYGFIIRYPKDKVEITGVKHEPWHVRYVGKEVATYIMETGLTLEEFTQESQAVLKAYEAKQGGWSGEGPAPIRLSPIGT